MQSNPQAFADLRGQAIPVLPCETDPSKLRVGQTLVVLGYPTGFDMLLARLGQGELDEIMGDPPVSFDALAHNLAQRGMIQPVATRGMCGRIGRGRVVYDAATAIGASGAPVLNVDGKVVAINTALMKGFAGTNFGVPIDRALGLLEGSRPAAALAQANSPIKK